MTTRFPIPRPTESAAIRAAGRSPRRLPHVTSLLAALLDANERRDREAATLCAHLVVRAAAPETIHEH